MSTIGAAAAARAVATISVGFVAAAVAVRVQEDYLLFIGLGCADEDAATTTLCGDGAFVGFRSLAAVAVGAPIVGTLFALLGRPRALPIGFCVGSAAVVALALLADRIIGAGWYAPAFVEPPLFAFFMGVLATLLTPRRAR